MSQIMKKNITAITLIAALVGCTTASCATTPTSGIVVEVNLNGTSYSNAQVSTSTLNITSNLTPQNLADSITPTTGGGGLNVNYQDTYGFGSDSVPPINISLSSEHSSKLQYTTLDKTYAIPYTIEVIGCDGSTVIKPQGGDNYTRLSSPKTYVFSAPSTPSKPDCSGRIDIKLLSVGSLSQAEAFPRGEYSDVITAQVAQQ
jgi:hypothetical protein